MTILMNPSQILPVIMCGLAGFLVSSLVIRLILRFANAKASESRTRAFHQTHHAPIPRTGGLALAVAFVLVVALSWMLADMRALSHERLLVIAIGAIMMFGLGFWDDLRPLGAKVKLAAQLLLSVLVYVAGVRIQTMENPMTGTVYDLGAFSLFATVFWLVALTNIVNLVDGIDGLAGGIGLMVMSLLAFVGFTSIRSFPHMLTIGMAGALVGFLMFNFPPAKIFMGDGGAYFLGFLIGLLTIEYSQKITVAAALIAPLLALAMPIADVTLTIARRAYRGLPIFRADKRHLHHRLLEKGYSRRGALLALYSFSLVFLFVAFGVSLSSGLLIPVLYSLLFLPLIVAVRSTSICILLMIFGAIWASSIYMSIFFVVMAVVFIAIARPFGFLREWFVLERMVETSLELRRQTQSALTFCRWFEMELQRCDSVDEIWSNFLLVCQKLRIQCAELRLNNGVRTWAVDGFDSGDKDLYTSKHSWSGDGEFLELTLSAGRTSVSRRIFDQMAELGAESWFKAMLFWQEKRGREMTWGLAEPDQSAVTETAIKALRESEAS